MVKKTALSFSGYSFWEWLLGNWGTLKEAIKVLIPLFVATKATQDVTWIIVDTVLGKFILDAAHYFLKKR